MASLNKTMLIGNLGRDPETSYTPAGLAVCRFSIATTEVWKDKNTGEKKEAVEWHRIVAFSKLAETCGKYLTKGKQIYIEGHLKTSSYEKDGITRYSTDIIMDSMQFLGSRDSGQAPQQNNGFQKPQAQQNDAFQRGNFQAPPAFTPPPDDNVPF